MADTEIELKFPLLDINGLITTLNSISKKEKESLQIDYYFNHPKRSFLATKPVSEWLRIRESDKGNSINYKNWHKDLDAKSISCDEFETKVEDVSQCKKLFAALGFEELMTVEKKRSTYIVDSVEVAVDEVKGLGNFIELEAKKPFENTGEAKKHLFKVLEKIGAKVGEQDFEGYPYLILKKKGLI
jgi:adenylate cyclase class 2